MLSVAKNNPYPQCRNAECYCAESHDAHRDTSDHYIKTLFCILLQFSLFMLSDVDILSDVAMLSAVARLSVVILGPWGLYYKTFYDRNLRIFQPGSPV